MVDLRVIFVNFPAENRPNTNFILVPDHLNYIQCIEYIGNQIQGEFELFYHGMSFDSLGEDFNPEFQVIFRLVSRLQGQARDDERRHAFR